MTSLEEVFNQFKAEMGSNKVVASVNDVDVLADYTKQFATNILA